MWLKEYTTPAYTGIGVVYLPKPKYSSSSSKHAVIRMYPDNKNTRTLGAGDYPALLI